MILTIPSPSPPSVPLRYLASKPLTVEVIPVSPSNCVVSI